MKKIQNFILDNLILIIAIIGLVIYLGSVGETFGIVVVAIPAVILIKNLGDIIFLAKDSIETKKNMFTTKKVFFIIGSTLLSILFLWLIRFKP